MDDIFVSGTKQEPRGRDDKADGENHKEGASKGRERKEESQDDGEQPENRSPPRQSTNSEHFQVYGEKRRREKLYNITENQSKSTRSCYNE